MFSQLGDEEMHVYAALYLFFLFLNNELISIFYIQQQFLKCFTYSNNFSSDVDKNHVNNGQ